MKTHQPQTQVGTARCAVRATERSVKWRNETREWPGTFRRLALRSATGTSQRNVPTILVALALALTLCGCGTAKVTVRHEISPTPAAKAAVIFVADFDLDAADITSEPGLLPPPPKAPGPFGGVLPPLPGAPKDADTLARGLVDAMSAALVNDLTQAGLTARRWHAANLFPPTAGLCVACSRK